MAPLGDKRWGSAVECSTQGAWRQGCAPLVWGLSVKRGIGSLFVLRRAKPRVFIRPSRLRPLLLDFGRLVGRTKKAYPIDIKAYILNQNP